MNRFQSTFLSLASLRIAASGCALALVTMTGCSGAPASSGDADDVTVRPSRLGTESYNFNARTFGYLEPTGYPIYTVDIQGGGAEGWLQTYWTNPYAPANQMFTIGSKHSILNEAGSCLDIPDSIDQNHTPIDANACNGQSNQAWYFYSATMKALGKCVDVPGGNETPGTNVQVYTCNGGSNQNWWLYYDSLQQGQAPDAFEIQDASRNRCLYTNGNGQVVIEECGYDDDYEVWMHGENGSFWNLATGTCLTASSSNDGTHLTATTCSGSANQQFTLTGELRTGIDDSMCLDVEGGTSGAGVPLQIFSCNGGANQIFSMYE